MLYWPETLDFIRIDNHLPPDLNFDQVAEAFVCWTPGSNFSLSISE